MSYIPRPHHARKTSESQPFLPYLPATPKSAQNPFPPNPFHKGNSPRRDAFPMGMGGGMPPMGMFNAGMAGAPANAFPAGYAPAYMPAQPVGHSATGGDWLHGGQQWGQGFGPDPRYWGHQQPQQFPPRSRSAPPPEADSRPAWNSLLAPADMIGDDTASSDMILWDVRQKKATDVDGTKLPKSALNLNAIQPNVNKLVLISPDLPWKIVVSNPKGITVNDVLTAVYDTLNAQITEPEYWLASEEAQKRMNRAYLDATNGKTGVPGREPTEGVKRVDFLGDSILFGGIRPLDERDDVFVKKRNASTPRKVEELWIIEFGEPED